MSQSQLAKIGAAYLHHLECEREYHRANGRLSRIPFGQDYSAASADVDAAIRAASDASHALHNAVQAAGANSYASA